MSMFTANIRYAMRSIRRTPLVSGIVVSILSLSIAVLTMLFSVVNGIFLHPLPFTDSESAINLGYLGSVRGAVDELHRTTTQLSEIATFEETELTLEAGGDPTATVGSRIDTMFFPILRAGPIIGSLPHRRELECDEPVALISERLWAFKFGRRGDIVGVTVRVNGRPRRIVGVMPGWFTFPERSQVWIPFGVSERGLTENVLAVGRMRRGGSLEVVQQEARLVSSRLSAADPARFRLPLARGGLYPQKGLVMRGDRFGSTTMLWVILVGASCVLIIACTNLAALMLARGLRRRGEILIRACLGASRLQLLTHQLTEGLILGALSGVLGVLLSVWGLRFLLAVQPAIAAAIPGWVYLGIDWRVGVFASMIAMAAVVVFSLWPAVEAVRVEISGALRSGADQAVSHRDATRRLHLPLVLQVSVSVMLLVTSAILARSAFEYGRGRTSLLRDLYAARLVSDRPGDTTLTRYTQFHLALDRVLQGQGGPYKFASSAAYAGLSDSAKRSDFDLRVVDDNRYLADGGSYPGIKLVSDNYFDVLGVRLLQGRSFNQADPAGVATSVVVSQRFAREVWGSDNVIGKALLLGKTQVRVVGVSENIRRAGMGSGRVALEEGRDVFLSERQGLTCCRRWVFIVRADRGASGVPSMISTAALSIGLTSAVRVRPFVNEGGDRPRNIVMATVLGGFALAGIVLAAMGVYGVVAFSVVHRLREAGIRLAIGAQGIDIVRLMMKGGMRLVSIGILVGLCGSIAVAKLLSAFVITTPVTSVVAALAATLLFLGVGAVACYVPARRSGGVDPARLLRE